MTVEIELKLRIAPDQLAELKRHKIFRSHSVTRPVTRRLYNIYFDTSKCALRKSGMALRLRRIGRQWLQTLKGGGSVKGGLHQRNEWEMPVRGPALDFSLPQTAEWEEYLPQSWRKKLQPVFVTDFSRSSRILDWQGAEIELCMDQGEVRTDQFSTVICEIELELKSGEPAALFELALAILEIVPFELEPISKAEQGYRLLSGHIDRPFKGVLPNFAGTDALMNVLQALIWSCLLHLQNNLHGAMEGGNAEYLHQMRVALRRLRVVLRMAEEFHADAQLAVLKKDVAALCVILGRAREWDVFIAQTLQPMCARMPDHGGLQALLADSEQQRIACYDVLRGKMHELQGLMLRFAIWMNAPYWQQQAVIGQAGDFAARYLHKLAKRFIKSGQKLDVAVEKQLHDLRILAKKLRYSAEFFAVLYDRKKIQPDLAALSKVQETLGQINDAAVAHRLLDDLSLTSDLPEHQEAVALAESWIAHDLPHQFAALHKSFRRFYKQKAFWNSGVHK